MVKRLTRITTDGLTPSQAKEYWADHVGVACHSVQFDFQPGERFEGSVEYEKLGFGKLTHFRLNGGHETFRTPKDISKDKEESLYLALVRDGSGSISSRGRDVSWETGHVYCGGISDPYQFMADRYLEFSIIFFDMAYIRSAISCPEDIFLRELTTASGWGKALTAVMQEITPRTVNHLALPPSAVADHIVGLLALSAGPDPDPLRSNRRSFLERLRRELWEQLFDPTLSPTRFAAEQGISVRTLHATFAAAGSSFMKELIVMRLSRARSLLEDRRFDSKTIGEIASLVGFMDAAHFTARFRKAFGIPPMAWRLRKQS